MATIEEIIKWFKEQGNKTVLSNQNLSQEIIAPKAIDSAVIDNISFLNAKNKDRVPELLIKAQCKIVILESSLADKELINSIQGMSFIFSDNPKADLLLFCKKFLGFDQKIEKTEIHSSASIAESAVLGKNIIVSTNVVIGDKVEIGDNCQIGSNTVIESNTILGDNVEIGSNSVIGGVGFGYAQDELTKQYVRFPHYGRVIIHNNVSIGNNTCIDRGSLSDTIMHDGVKIDNLVHIAHNVFNGENTAIAACVGVAGSTSIGKNCTIGGGSGINGHIKIVDNVHIHGMTMVTKSINKEGMYASGTTVEPVATWRKNQARFKELDILAKAIKKIT